MSHTQLNQTIVEFAMMEKGHVNRRAKVVHDIMVNILLHYRGLSRTREMPCDHRTVLSAAAAMNATIVFLFFIEVY
jgi:hypothetical protein